MVTKIQKRGYCVGVKMAIQRVKNLRKEHPKTPITVLGWLVHNERVVKELNAFGIKTLDDTGTTRLKLLDKVKDGILVLTAHGTSEEVKRAALKKGLRLFDTTCHFVNVIEDKIKNALNKGQKVIYIGKRGHPETESVLALDESIILVENVFDVLSLPKDKTYFAINQTTLSILDLEEIYETIEKLYDAEIDNKTCLATTERQQAVIDLTGHKFIYVVGDKRSNNTNMLLKTVQSKSIDGKIISSADEVETDVIIKYGGRLAVTAGASTPPYVIKEVEDKIDEILDKSKRSAIVT